METMTDALSSRALTRPPNQGPGSDIESWRAFAAQETGRSIEGDLDKVTRRDELIALVDQAVAPEAPKEAPEGVEVYDAEEDAKGRLRPPRIDNNGGGPQWAVPVEGGYVGEDDLTEAEREAAKARQAERHKDRLTQLKGKR